MNPKFKFIPDEFLLNIKIFARASREEVNLFIVGDTASRILVYACERSVSVSDNVVR